MKRKRLGALQLENVISLFTGAEPGETAIIIEHKIDTPTMIVLAAIPVGTVLLYFGLKNL